MGIDRVKRTAIALMLILMMSFGTVFATGEEAPAGPQQDQETTVQEEALVSRIIRKGKYYYYKQEDGSIRTKAGFVRDLGNIYYVRKGGRIQTDKTFRIGKYKYRAYKDGVIATGVYKWRGKKYYSDSKGRWKKKESIVSWNGNKYYLDRNGVVAVNAALTYKNEPYLADKKGRLKKLDIPEGGKNKVVAVAKKQVGVMTGKTYWKWYFHSRFIDTDRTPWCGTFVAWCYNKAGQYGKISGISKYGNLGYVPSYSRYAGSRNKWVKTSAAKPGDVVVFGRDSHVGIVEGITDGCLITIEGNTGPTAAFGCGKAGAVCRKAYKLKDKGIKGILHP